MPVAAAGLVSPFATLTDATHAAQEEQLRALAGSRATLDELAREARALGGASSSRGV